MYTIKHNRAALVELIIAICGIAGISISDHIFNIYGKIGVAVGLSIACAIIIIRRDKQIYTFAPNSPQLAKFFAEWYHGEGELVVYCNDLNWVHAKELDDA